MAAQSEDIQKKICDYCFGNLTMFLQQQQPKEYPKEFDDEVYPLFVTWQKSGNLRGCIGTFGFNKLGETLQQYSLVAAVKDSRFAAMTIADLNEQLSC